MRNPPRRAAAYVAIGLLSCGLVVSGSAGASPKTAADDGRNRMQSQTYDGKQSGYTVREIHYGQAFMRQFIASSGVIFALDWRRMPEPDLKNLLGSTTNDERLEDSLPIFGRINSTTAVWERDIILDESFVSGDSHGRAYVPCLVPSGVTIGDVWRR